jgi:zinc protease
VLADKADRSQARIVLGHPALDAADPDYLAVHLATTAFGGTFSARLMQEVRVKRGLSYGCSARVIGDRVGGYYTLSAAPEAADVAQTLELLLAEYRRFVADGLTDAEIDFARGYLVNAWIFGQETASARVAQRLNAVMLGRSVDFPDTWPKTIAAISADAVRDAARRRLTPEDLVAVVVCSAPDLRDAVAAVPGVDRVSVRRYDALD